MEPRYRYGEGQIRCDTCNIWLWSDYHSQRYKEEEISPPPEFGIHTHKSVRNAAGELVFEANGDPYGGIRCDCCNGKTSSRPYSLKYNSRTPELEAQEKIISSLTFEDAELSLPSAAAMKQAIKGIQDQILIDEDTILKIVASLVSGKNILLTGAVGTGKTHLAKILPEIVWRENEIAGYHADVYTATSDWTTKDVIGGIVPKLDEDEHVTYSIEKGCVTETVSKNWRDESSEEKIRVFFNAESNIDGEERKFRGKWLTIDEFNRADIDKSFGQLFTAIEHGKMKIPTISQGRSYDDLELPMDYRIIGTLNTSDKHFLNTLSDALKRRFTVIELFPASYDQQDTELYYVVVQALEKLGNHVTALEVDKGNKTIIWGKDHEAEEILKSLYRIMAYIRQIKPLGTALLVSMFKIMIVYHALDKNWAESLDLALTSNLLPQLESQQYWKLKIIKAVICDSPSQFFRTDKEFTSSNENYLNEIDNLCRFLKIMGKSISGAKKRLRGGEKLQDSDKDTLNVWDDASPEFKTLGQPDLPQFRSSLRKIINETSYDYEPDLDEEEVEESTTT